MTREEASFFYRDRAGLAAVMTVFLCTGGCLDVISLHGPIPLSDTAQEEPVDDGDAPAELDIVPDPDGRDGVPETTDPEESEDLPVETEDAADPPPEDVPADEVEDVSPDPDVPDGPELPPGLVWVSIPAGSFEMGCSTGDTSCASNENPRHMVDVPAFEMTEAEITQDQYESVTGTNPSSHVCANCPVEHVSWREAKAFCEAIGGRLPTEAEWEYAARAGTTTRYTCESGDDCLGDVAWYSGNSGGTTHTVKRKTANDFGLHDMLGNVWEWAEDCFHSTYSGAPSDGSAWISDCTETNRMLRGGACSDGHYGDPTVRVSVRHWDGPDVNSYGVIGFRCAR